MPARIVLPGANVVGGKIVQSRRHKFGVSARGERTVGGVVFHSKKEAKRWLALCGMAERGEISGLRRQVKFPLEVCGRIVANYVADFVYETGGASVVEDVKSPPTRKLEAYRIKRALMLACRGVVIVET